ncbi:MAG TPA: carboxy terminal-processing peptidase [Gammaproteobacteria bacterium]|nr:carboxy terminal-processing peptidase [Gammaproteobacteria bacterium]
MRNPTRYLTPTLLVCLLAAPAAFANLTPSKSLADLTPKPEQVLVDQTVNGLLSRYHYGDKTLNNALSRYIFRHYLSTLDPTRSYFTQADIEKFSKYGRTLGDDIRKGNLEPAFNIYNAYKRHVAQQVQYALKLLQHKPDLTTHETYTFDREKAQWPANQKALDALWHKRVTNDVINLMLTGKSWEDTAKILRKRYKNFLSQARQINSADVFNAFMNTYAHAMDPHTAYFSPEQSEQFRIEMSLKLQGIGAALTTKNQYVTVERVLPGGPAAKSDKIHPGDRITAVAQGDDGKWVDVVGWRLSDVVDLIRGKKGTVVRLQIMPSGTAPGAAEKHLRLVRNVIELKAQQAHSKVMDIKRGDHTYKIGVITVPSFYRDFKAASEGKKDYRSTTRDVRRLIGELKQKHIDALVLDLRDNPGGSLAEATEMTGLFIDKGPVVQIRDTDGKVKVHRDENSNVAYSGPLVVVVNRFSASASEIFTAAIQDYHRGLIVGSTTYGKGTVQTLLDLNHFVASGKAGQLKLTIAKFYRITGSSTQDHGVTPDIALPSPIDDSEFGEATQDNALPWDKISAADYHPFHDQLRKSLPTLRHDHKQRVEHSAKYQLFLKDVAQARTMHEQKSVSLNLKARRAERESHEAQKLADVNAWRKLNGKKPVKSLSDVPSDESAPDVLLHEAAQIAADMHRMHLGIREPGTAVAKARAAGF